jgi:hypothetical protein
MLILRAGASNIINVRQFPSWTQGYLANRASDFWRNMFVSPYPQASTNTKHPPVGFLGKISYSLYVWQELFSLRQPPMDFQVLSIAISSK